MKEVNHMTHTIINHRPFLIFLSFIHESCVDHSDTLLDRDALRYIVPHFTTPGNSERVGAVTGNPHIQQQMEDLLPRNKLLNTSLSLDIYFSGPPSGSLILPTK
jgi:hypothetical protein